MKRLDAEKFVVAWTKASTVDEVAAATGMKAQGCVLFAGRLRKQGVKLKKMGALDIASLNQLIADAEKK